MEPGICSRYPLSPFSAPEGVGANNRALEYWGFQLEGIGGLFYTVCKVYVICEDSALRDVWIVLTLNFLLDTEIMYKREGLRSRASETNHWSIEWESENSHVTDCPRTLSRSCSFPPQIQEVCLWDSTDENSPKLNIPINSRHCPGSRRSSVRLFFGLPGKA